MEKQIDILGYIICPTCGTHEGLRITRDKNGHPFGWCEKSCGQQLRVGPDPRRVRDFFKLYPQLTERSAEPPAPDSKPEPAATAAAEPPPKPAKKRSAFEEGLSILGAV